MPPPRPLIIRPRHSSLLFFEDLVLGNQILNGLPLLPVEPIGQGKENQLPGMEDERHSAPDAENNAPSIFWTRYCDVKLPGVLAEQR